MSICIPLKICMAFSLVTSVVGECVDDGSSGVSGRMAVMSCQLAFLLGWVGIGHIVLGVQIVGVEVQGDLVVRNGRFQIPQLQVAVAQVKGSGGLLSGSDPHRTRACNKFL